MLDANRAKRPARGRALAKRGTRRRRKGAASRGKAGLGQRLRRFLRRWSLRIGLGLVALVLLWVALYGLLPVPTTAYMLREQARLGEIRYDWVPMEDISETLQRSAVAAEDANFCRHYGFDMSAIRAAIEAGAERGGSTISQQVVKNAFLWHGRSWLRKALEAALTPVAELFWTKRRMLEVYLNVAEFAEGVFGAEAGAQHHFGVSARDLTPQQAALMAAVLPAPQSRDAAAPTPFVTQRAAAIADGAATIRADGRDACFAN